MPPEIERHEVMVTAQHRAVPEPFIAERPVEGGWSGWTTHARAEPPRSAAASAPCR